MHHFPAGTSELAQRIKVALQQPFVIGEHELYITASIGISCFPNDGRDLESLMRTADAAVYTAKQQGRNTIAFYSAEMNDTAIETLRHAEQFADGSSHAVNSYSLVSANDRLCAAVAFWALLKP